MVDYNDLTTLIDSNGTDVLTERAFYDRWQLQIDPQWSPEQIAFAAGAFASTPSFLFIAGYQSAVIRTFGATDSRWRALAISEDRSPENPAPGVTLSGDENGRDGKINGFKTWVACSDHLTHVIFTAAGNEGNRLYHIEQGTNGLTIHSKPKAKFLGDMSQGIAEFNDVDASSLTLLLTEAETDAGDSNSWATVMKQFAKREPLYLFFALCGRLHHHGNRDMRDLTEKLLTIASGDFSDPNHKLLFADVDSALNGLFPDLFSETFASGTQQDQSVLSLYSPVIQKRAGLG